MAPDTAALTTAEQRLLTWAEHAEDVSDWVTDMVRDTCVSIAVADAPRLMGELADAVSRLRDLRDGLIPDREVPYCRERAVEVTEGERDSLLFLLTHGTAACARCRLTPYGQWRRPVVGGTLCARHGGSPFTLAMAQTALLRTPPCDRGLLRSPVLHYGLPCAVTP